MVLLQNKNRIIPMILGYEAPSFKKYVRQKDVYLNTSIVARVDCSIGPKHAGSLGEDVCPNWHVRGCETRAHSAW